MELNLIVAIVLFVVGICLLIHHGCHHHLEDPEISNAQKESCVVVCYFQPKDINHLETWCLVCLCSSFSVGVISPPFYLSNVLAISLCVIGALLMIIACLRGLLWGSASGFQFHNICNHETWILVCFFGAIFAIF